MKNDLSKCKVGDRIWTISHGWVKITRVCAEKPYPIYIKSSPFYNTLSYTFEGKHSKDDQYPSAFLKPPEGFDVEPRPVEKVKLYKWAYKIPNGDWLETDKFYKSEKDVKECLDLIEKFFRLDRTMIEVEL